MNLLDLRYLALVLMISACGGGGSGGGTAAPTVTLSAAPTTIASGNASTLTWNTTNADACTGWQGATATSGSQSTGALTTTTSFALSCSGKGGSAQASVTVTVVPPPTLTFNAAPTNVASGDASTLTWNTNATSCTASGGWQGTQATSGSQSTGALSIDHYIHACVHRNRRFDSGVDYGTVGSSPQRAQCGCFGVAYRMTRLRHSAGIRPIPIADAVGWVAMTSIREPRSANAISRI